MNLDEITRQAAQRYYVDKGIYRNPHAPGSDAYNAFERGWMQSLKKDGGGLFCTPHVQNKPPNAPTDTEIQAEIYRKRKG
jgi:hypothetical protein